MHLIRLSLHHLITQLVRVHGDSTTLIFVLVKRGLDPESEHAIIFFIFDRPPWIYLSPLNEVHCGPSRSHSRMGLKMSRPLPGNMNDRTEWLQKLVFLTSCTRSHACELPKRARWKRKQCPARVLGAKRR